MLYRNAMGRKAMNASSNSFVEMRDIVKVYPNGTVALRGVSLSVRKGEILGLLGENGAGKTTLMKILSGVLPYTRGKIVIEGREVKFRNPAEALSLGIGMVHQHFTLVPPFTALQNIILGVEMGVGRKSFTGLFKPVELERIREELEKLMEETGLTVPLDVPIEKMPLGLRQRTEILKVLYRGVRLLILDEPTTFLTPMEVEELFTVMRKLKSQGKTVIFITHKIKEALEITDRIVVLRKGLVVGELPTSEATPEKLAEMMVGKKMELEVKLKGKGPSIKKPVLEVRDLHVRNDLGALAVKGVSLEVYPGEILGIAGVEGNGQDELVEAITGLREPEKGVIRICGKEVTSSNPIVFYREGLCHIPGDRDRYGLVLEFTLTENTILGRQWEPRFMRGMRINWGAVKRFTEEIVRKFNIVAQSVSMPAKSLSGGNRQRLVVGRELTKNPSVIVAVHPTRGLDIASTMYIRETLAKYRDEGKAILLVSADLDEIMQLSDRIAVMYEGEIIGVRKADETDRREIGLLMGGIQSREAESGKKASAIT